ncbi:MAG: FtsX-like permease family protein [Thermoplasmata archaeon]|nr:FtsX-like permease family protein [Thermoplasmata archaeon]MCI4341751.1 FtsX-like permease family protein [Thermoplasmata archaeon]
MDAVSFLLLIVLAVVLFSAVLVWRHRMVFRISVRNLRRGRTRTLLVILGLLIGTAIISGSLVIGDTIDQVSVHFAYESFGYVDEALYNQSAVGTGYSPFSYAVYPALVNATSSNSQIAGITPEVVASVGMYDRSTQIPQTNLNLVGANANQSGALGSFVADNGSHLAGPSAGGVYLDDLSASDVAGRVGDSVVVSGASRLTLTVQAIVKDSDRGGFLGGESVFVSLATAQTIQNDSGRLNFLAVTNAGSVTGGLALTNSVSTYLNATLPTLGPIAHGVTVHPLLQESVNAAAAGGSSFETLLLVLGLFSIVAGVMLIVGIFVTLAEERKGEMGMLRAIGLKRRELVYSYYFEGLFYAAGSAFAGALLGVGIGYGLIYAFSTILSSNAQQQAAILDSFTISPTSLSIAFAIGFLLTLATIVGASFRAGRLNIVRAIRSVPEPPPSIRVYSYLAYLGAVFVLLGALLLVGTYRGNSDISLPTIGGILVIAGGMFIATRFVRNRIAFTAGSLSLLVWVGFEPLRRVVLGTQHTGTIFVIFVEGISLVLAAVMLYIFNASTVVAGVSRLLRSRPGAVSIARIGLSYPSRRPFRTAINLTIFALVLFTIVSVASFGSSVEANLNQTIEAESGGYTLFGFSDQPIANLPGAIAANHSLSGFYSNVVPLDSAGVGVAWSGLSGTWSDSIYAAPANVSGPTDFYTSNEFNFSSTLHGASTGAVWQQLRTDPTAAVVDGDYGSSSGGFGPSHPLLSTGTVLTLTNGSGITRNVTVIGILAETFVTGIWVDPSTGNSLGANQPDVFFLRVAPGQDPVRASQLTKSAFFAEGLVLLSFADILRTSIQATVAIINLLQVFVGLGLAVGIAAIGLVAFRAVVERRSEIGMLRAIGFRQRGIFAVFLLEYSYVALLGILIGTALAILLIYNATIASTSGSTGGLSLAFAPPWLDIGIVLLSAYVLMAAAVLTPSLKAARLAPAEALRYSE